MGRVTKDSQKEAKPKFMTLKAWYQMELSRLSTNNELKDLKKYAPLVTFFGQCKIKYGSEFALKTRSEWTQLYRDYLD